MPAKSSKRILVAPLDWGLGHTTRCIPIIRHLQARGHQVLVAGNDAQQRFLATVVEGIEWLSLQGYDVRYARNSHFFMPKLLAQLPRIGYRIMQEHKWLQHQVKTQHIDAVISDNRYGLHADLIPCVIMTHQLQVLSGMGAVPDRMVRKLHYRLLEHFDSCWIVDKAQDAYSGTLGHPSELPGLPCHYLGLLSDCAQEEHTLPQEQSYVLVLLSGTEPQRSILQDQLWQQCISSHRQIVFVAGSLHGPVPDIVPPHIRFVQRVSGATLHELIAGAAMVICRSGYSTVMDLAAMGKKAILIPTPGQTEQEYLGRYLHEKGLFFRADQRDFDLQQALNSASSFPYEQWATPSDFFTFRTVIDNFLGQL